MGVLRTGENLVECQGVLGSLNISHQPLLDPPLLKNFMDLLPGLCALLLYRPYGGHRALCMVSFISPTKILM